MKHRFLRRTACFLLVLTMLLSLLPAAFAEGEADIAAHETRKPFTSPDGTMLISQTDYTLTRGVTENHVILNNADGTAQVLGYLTTVEPGSNVEFKASYSGYYTKNSTPESRRETVENNKLKWDLRTTTKQAADFENATGETVIWATNGDFYNMQTGQPRGHLIMEGNVVQTGNGIDEEPYFAILKDGTYAIRDYAEPCDDVLEAISGPFYLVKDGVQITNGDPYLAPRNSIGLKADGSVILFLADGRAGRSNGMTTDQVGAILLANGAVDALYLDGGGSATLASRHEGSETLEVQNYPSDGPERTVSSALLMVTHAEETGTFDHAALTPKNEVYVAGAQVQFTANGVDAGGYPAPIPANAGWKLEDSSFGTIDSTGLFKSSGKCGTVKVNLNVSNKTVGSTTIEVQEPTALYFASEQLNLGFHATSDLDLVVKYNTRVMQTAGVVFDWEIISRTEGVDAAGIGSFSGNLFTSTKAKQTLNADIRVSYTRDDGTVLTDTIAIEIGRMPQILWDFEPDENGEIGKGVAEYDWGDASVNPAGFTPDETPITFYAWEGSAEEGGCKWKTESGPFFFDGWYLADENDVCRYPAGSVFGAAGYEFFTDRAVHMKPHAASGDIVTAENGEVRFGDYALRWDYDYRDMLPGYRNVSAWLNTTADDIALPGTPSGLGFWVYAPEGTANFWLWIRIAYTDPATGVTYRPYLHLKTQDNRNMQYTGIYWEGWKYVEADLTPYAKYVTPETPLKILKGTDLIDLTFIPGGSPDENGNKIPMGDFTAGSLYFDNFRLVYGATIDDMENPVIDGISANGAALGEDTVTVSSNTVEIKASFSDPVSENATGINSEKTALYVDGIKQPLASATESGANAMLALPNGIHSIMLRVSDGFGNVTKLTRYINVNAAGSKLGTVVLAGESTATLGEDYTLTLTLDNSTGITGFATALATNGSFGEPSVTFENGYEGTAAYENNTLKLQASAATPKTGVAATIKFHVDPATARGTTLHYELKSGSFTDGGKEYTFGVLPTDVDVTAAYELSTDIMVVNSTGKIYVTRADGSAPGRVEVYKVTDGEPELLGTTNSAGVLVTNKLCRTLGETYTIYAKGDAGWSFRVSGVTNAIGSDDASPYNIRLNAGKEPGTTQSITWFSAPGYTARRAVVQLAEGAIKKSADDAYTTFTGTSVLTAFNGNAGDNNAAYLNTVLLTGLEAGKTYRYRVGDGANWSAERQFTTVAADTQTSFFVIGDTQLSGNEEADAEAIAAMDRISEAINKENVNFGIQTGDYIDVANSQSRWNQILTVFGDDYPTLPIVQVLGNHEYYGDNKGALAEAIFDLPDIDYYSVEYGNVYVAVINCNANLDDAAAWLKEDAAKSDCTWKVLTLHQPPYYTNPKGSSAPYNKTIPAAAEAAGIDFVFSGHDHAYARTNPITAGQVNEENGVVYFICGDLGEKSRDIDYAIENNPEFHFAKTTQDYEAVYLTVKTAKTDKEQTMTVTAHDLDGTVLDTYTKTVKKADDPIQPDPTHEYIYNRASGKLTCSECGEEAPRNYTGWATDGTSKEKMYFINGVYKTGWFQLGDEFYHFDTDNGNMHKIAKIEGTRSTCTTQGHLTITCSCGETKAFEDALPSGHSNEAKVGTDGKTYYICTQCSRISLYDLTFADVEDSDWFAPNIEYVCKHELFSGRSALVFDPNTSMSRIELVSVIWRLDGKPDFANTTQPVFTDCKAGAWYTAALNWASKNQIVNGMTETTFCPDDEITREQIVTIFYRYAKFKEMDTSEKADFEKTFKDGTKVSDYAQEAMSWAVGSGLIQGDENHQINPQSFATRAEVATMVMRFHQMISAD